MLRLWCFARGLAAQQASPVSAAVRAPANFCLSSCQRAQAGACFGLSAAACRTGFLLAARSSWLAAPGGLAASIAFSSAGFMLQARQALSQPPPACLWARCSVNRLHRRARPAERCRAHGCHSMSMLRVLSLLCGHCVPRRTSDAVASPA
jgi:hypothetical protein